MSLKNDMSFSVWKKLEEKRLVYHCTVLRRFYSILGDTYISSKDTCVMLILKTCR